MDVHLQIVLVGSGEIGGWIRVERDGCISHDCDGGSMCVVARAQAGGSEVATEEDSQGWGGGAHYADLKLELRPEEKVEGRAGYVD